MFENIEIFNLKTAWREAAQALKKVGINTPLLDARLLLQEVLKISYEELIVSAERLITDDERAIYISLLQKRLKREPVSKILGLKEFWGLNFKTTKDNLDPRPDSETLIEAITKNYTDSNRDLKILDLGTGSGCLLITLLSLYDNATGIGADVSEGALNIARENANINNIGKRVEFIKSDWFENIEGKFDIIISNPPYIKSEAIEHLEPEVRFYDPMLALDGGADGLTCYRDIISVTEDYLDVHGKCFLEIGKWQESQVSDIIENYEFEIFEIKEDLKGIPRVISFSKPYLQVVK